MTRPDARDQAGDGMWGTSTGAQPRAEHRRAGLAGPLRRGPLVVGDGAIASLLERRSGDRRRAVGQRSAQIDLDTRSLCHDLRQPLAAAALLGQLLAREVGLSAVAQERLEVLQRELGRLGAMVNAHLDEPRTELVDLASLAQDVLRPSDAGPAERLDLEEERAALVLGDPVLLTRMLANLVANARAAAGRSGHVRVTVGRQGDQARVVVEDSGTNDEPSPSGHGLGLLIVDAVAARHGGGVRCGQSELGGLRLTVLLPGLVGWSTGDRA